MSETAAYRVRLRVRIGKPLTTEELLLTAEVAGREVTIKSQKKEEPLREATWILLIASGFETEGAAREFGEHLRQIIEIVALCARLGVDVGQDRSTTWINEEWARSIGMIQPHERLMPNIHGLMVIPEDDLTRFPLVEAQGTVTANPAQLLTGINELGRQVPVQLASSAAACAS